jgi:hypothetical protein
MRKLLVGAGALALASLLVSGSGARAEESGLAGMHDWVRSGSKTCMADHYHDGSGTGRTKSAARREAIRSWSDFTAWEYGNAWGRYSLAASKSMNCSGSRGNYSCSTSARPCRWGRR